jgi:hypothetical protein
MEWPAAGDKMARLIIDLDRGHLIVQQRWKFVFVDIPDKDGKTAKYGQWTQKEKDAFVKAAKEDVKKTWSRRVWLTPTGDTNPFQKSSSKGYPLLFEILETPFSASDQHWLVYVYKKKPWTAWEKTDDSPWADDPVYYEGKTGFKGSERRWTLDGSPNVDPSRRNIYLFQDVAGYPRVIAHEFYHTMASRNKDVENPGYIMNPLGSDDTVDLRPDVQYVTKYRKHPLPGTKIYGTEFSFYIDEGFNKLLDNCEFKVTQIDN